MSELKQYRIAGGSAAELVRSVESAVADGALAPGQRLPSVRALATDVGLSPVTVSSALAELRRRGVVVSEPRRGTRIGAAPPLGLPRAQMPLPAGARDLSRGNPDPALLPDLARAIARAEVPRRLYGEDQALPALLEPARAQMHADGIPAEHLCVTSGALDAVERVLQAHLRPGDSVAVENPGYAALYDLLRAQSLALEPVALDDRGMLPGALEVALARGAGAVVVTPRGQNPTGAALDAERAAELRTVLARFPGVLVLEDDHLGPVAGRELHTLAGAGERWAATRSVAKALGPDLRLAVLAGDAHTIARVQGRQQCGAGWVSHILQALVACMWRDPGVLELVERAGAVYAERRERFIACLAREGLSGHGASGLNVWVPVADEAGVLGTLLQRGWVLAAGARYRLPGAAPAVRVTTATLGERDAALLARELAVATATAGSTRSG